MFSQPFFSRIIRIPRKDIDTDLIIPAKYLRVTDTNGLKEGCFHELKKDPQFPMNKAEFSGARVLLAGTNFGCGSSREHAPWALKQSGIVVIISSEFADIFRGNAEKNGLLLIQLPEKDIQELFVADELLECGIDLPNQKISLGGKTYSFALSKFTKVRLLENLSEKDYLKKYIEQILLFEKKREKYIPILKK
jgi:3-isopropylmalate dehydratase small subunit